MRVLEQMNGRPIMCAGVEIDVHHCPVLVVGSGAAGLAAALRLHAFGVTDVVLLSEDRLAGTSRNTGSDKQTYYKLTLAGDAPDSVGRMAQTLFAGGCMDGDLARVEAALSAACFHWLCSLGVPFPRNAYGEAVGYKTDHDPLSRASSAGPLTSRMMVEALERSLDDTAVRLLDRHQAVRLLADPQQNRMLGVLALQLSSRPDEPPVPPRYKLVMAPHVILAVGGPAMVYADSVYPGSQLGGTGLALAAGARAANLTEWQYGLASVAPRWNVSGSYQQVLPRYVSTDADGGDARDFLSSWITDKTRRLGLVFRKGYQWPFDVRKLEGSSLVDLLVYHETVLRGRRVYLDFRSNDLDRPFELGDLDEETAAYLRRCDATAQLPWQRLRQMNEPAYAFYQSHGVDLAAVPLEIRLCAQHHNGGLAVDTDWQSSIRGLYAIGEACGTHGIYRPGGSALNSGQVGALRAAEHITRGLNSPDLSMADVSFRPADSLPEGVVAQLASLPLGGTTGGGKEAEAQKLREAWLKAGERMSRFAGPFRSVSLLADLQAEIEADLAAGEDLLRTTVSCEPALAWRYQDMLLTQRFLVHAMHSHVQQGGCSRGSALYLEDEGVLPLDGLPDYFRYRRDGLPLSDQVQIISLARPYQLTGPLEVRWRPVRPVPHPDESFEQVWRDWRRRIRPAGRSGGHLAEP